MPSANLYFATSLVSATHCAPETTPIRLLLMTHLSGADLQFSVPIFSSYLTSQQWWVQLVPLACDSGCLLCLLYFHPFFFLTPWLPSLRIFYRLFSNASSIHVFPPSSVLGLIFVYLYSLHWQLQWAPWKVTSVLMALRFAFLPPQADNVCNCLCLITLPAPQSPASFHLLLYLFSSYPETVPAGCQTWASVCSLVSVFPSHPNSVYQISSDSNTAPVVHAYCLQSHPLSVLHFSTEQLAYLCRSYIQPQLSLTESLSGLLWTECTLILKHSSQNYNFVPLIASSIPIPPIHAKYCSLLFRHIKLMLYKLESFTLAGLLDFFLF